MKLMFTKRYAWLCLCLSVSLCSGCATAFRNDVPSHLKERKIWVVKAVFPPGCNPAVVEAYYPVSGNYGFFINTHGTRIIDFYCPTIGQCSALVELLSDLGPVEILGIDKR